PRDLAERAGFDLSDYAAGRGTAALCAIAGEIADAAARHLQAAREGHTAVARSAIPALLPAVVADRFLLRLRHAGCYPCAPALAAPDPLQIWRLAFACLRGRF